MMQKIELVANDGRRYLIRVGNEFVRIEIENVEYYWRPIENGEINWIYETSRANHQTPPEIKKQIEKLYRNKAFW